LSSNRRANLAGVNSRAHLKRVLRRTPHIGSEPVAENSIEPDRPRSDKTSIKKEKDNETSFWAETHGERRTMHKEYRDFVWLTGLN
jgi:hypothetical protein